MSVFGTASLQVSSQVASCEGKKRLENTIAYSETYMRTNSNVCIFNILRALRILSECLKQPHLRAPAREALFPVWMASSTMDYGMVMATLQKERSDTTWT